MGDLCTSRNPSANPSLVRTLYVICPSRDSHALVLGSEISQTKGKPKVRMLPPCGNVSQLLLSRVEPNA